MLIEPQRSRQKPITKEAFGYVAAGLIGVGIGAYMGAELGMGIDVHRLSLLPIFPPGIGETFGATLLGMTGGVGGMIGFAKLVNGEIPSKRNF